MPFEVGIKHILLESFIPERLRNCIDNLHIDDWHEMIEFWQDCRGDGVEPDVIIKMADIVFLIEVKLYSYLSTDDEYDESSRIDKEYMLSENQLSRESRLLNSKYGNYKNKVLLLLAPESSALKINNDIKKREQNGDIIIATGVDFGYITWQKALSALQKIVVTNVFQQVIIQDLINLLIKKGFTQFDGFNWEIPDINPEYYWLFQ